MASESVTTSAPMANTGADAIERQVAEPTRKFATTRDEYYDFYEIGHTIATLRAQSERFQKVALQFPDLMLSDASFVYQELVKHCEGAEIFILADTSYGSCCIDEVAAEHAQADLIIHYGHSCLSAPSRIPVLYVFGKLPAEVDRICAAFQTQFPDSASAPVLLMYDVGYHHLIAEVSTNLAEKLGYEKLVVAQVPTEALHVASEQPSAPALVSETLPTDFKATSATEKTPPNASCDCRSSSRTPASGNQRYGRSYTLPDNAKLEDYSIFYIGADSLALSNLALTHNQCSIYNYDPKTDRITEQTPRNSKNLMKRYFMLQKAKDADVIGIVAGTLGVAHYMDVIAHIKLQIRQAGKKYYQFVMGKINVAKMANFMEIDAFVLVACPENSLIDSKEFYRPIVTPYELELSLRSDLEWTGKYITDFDQLLTEFETSPAADGSTPADSRLTAGEETDDDDSPHFSLVTGQFKQNRRYHPVQLDTSDLDTGVGSLTLRNANTDVSTVMGSAAGEYLLQRSFQGLEQKLGETEAAVVEEGRRGIARGYANEKEL
ncbi:Diphthamide biosynthesis protein 2 [Tieghemiomyces parasiticus]|uniref:2-(3-amino-3-carboxypropyl)histidine synthase subunit 2 n=1 Tax=Tieghemiomyces parasiticus TaxID=78921 RepID=A0A9W8DTB0_9FUNG|nr:Diphthamide biosynthesis protein 2 [Tieghemiomyces parasiticus]